MYNYFDSVVCISLDESTERRRQCVRNFEQLGIDDYSFYRTQRHKEGGRFGCFMSHINVIKTAYDKGLDNILIFEDDFIPSPSYDPQVIQEVIDFLQTKDDWDIMYLGHCMKCGGRPFYPPKKVTKSIHKMKTCCNEAYIVSRKGMLTILEEASTYLEQTEPKNVMHYDWFVYDTLEQSYGVLPLQFYQNNCMESYNSKPAEIRESISRFIKYMMKKSGLSKTCNYSYALSVLLYHYISITICLIMSIIILSTYNK